MAERPSLARRGDRRKAAGAEKTGNPRKILGRIATAIDGVVRGPDAARGRPARSRGRTGYSMPPPLPPDSARPRSGKRTERRLWAWRLLALVAVPAAFLAALEGSLRLAGYGQSVDFLIPDAEPGYWRSNPDFVSGYMPSQFDLRPLNFRIARRKPPGTVRVVVLGESAAQGVPAPAFGFAPQLRAQLRARFPGKRVEVIDTGIVAIDSHMIVPIARQLAGFEPDALVVYLGNNEVVGPYGPGCAYLASMPPLWVIRLSGWVRSTRTGQLLEALGGRLMAKGARAQRWGGMAMFERSAVRGDDPRLAAVYANFAANLHDIVRAGTAGGAKVLLCTVVSNLKDCAPFLSLHRAGMSPADLAAWRQAFARGQLEWRLGDFASAHADLAEAWRLDPHYAATAFLLGSIDLAEGNTAVARGLLVQAEHWDALRFRPDPRINALIRDEAERERGRGVLLLDAARIMGSDPDSDAPPAGRDYLYEHVHLNWRGDYTLARAMAEALDGGLGSVSAAPRGSWLDSDACAAALGYTPHEYPAVLREVARIVERPPFTGQLTYAEDEARLARQLAEAGNAAKDPAVLRAAAASVSAAEIRDPDNAELATIAESLDDDRGDLSAALAEATRARALQPWSYALDADIAIKQIRQGRYPEAERLLRTAARRCTPRDRALMAPAFADLYGRTRRWAEGRRYLETEVGERPTDGALRVVLARFDRLSGDGAAAEVQYRAALANDPGDEEALEGLVALCLAQNRRDEADRATAAAVETQPYNQANNLRAAMLSDRRGDPDGAVRCLLAAEDSGPVDAPLELNLAWRLIHLRRAPEAMEHLAEAWHLARIEGRTDVAASIRRTIDQILADNR